MPGKSSQTSLLGMFMPEHSRSPGQKRPLGLPGTLEMRYFPPQPGVIRGMSAKTGRSRIRLGRHHDGGRGAAIEAALTPTRSSLSCHGPRSSEAAQQRRRIAGCDAKGLKNWDCRRISVWPGTRCPKSSTGPDQGDRGSNLTALARTFPCLGHAISFATIPGYPVILRSVF